MKRVIGAFLTLCVAILSNHDRLHFTATPRRVEIRQPADPAASVPRIPKGSSERSSRIPQDYRSAPLRFVSTAPPESLQLLPGIGPVLADRIASARTGKRLFTRWEELLEVKGIGPKKLETLRAAASEPQ